MNILYEGFTGHAGIPVIGIILIILGTITFVVSIIAALNSWLSGPENYLPIVGTMLMIVFGILLLLDGRVPIVKATMNDTIPWKEVVAEYKLASQQGDIYTFEVLNTTNAEWERHLNEQH